MNLSGRDILIAVALSAFLLSSCGARNSGFVISLVESGEVILTDDHIATYIWKKHGIILTPEGIDQWESLAKLDETRDPPIRKLGKLTSKEFVVTVGDVEMYRGHFSSMFSSLIQPGVLLYDTMGAPRGEIRLDFIRFDGAPKDDPRARPEIAAHFRKQGKLKEDE